MQVRCPGSISGGFDDITVVDHVKMFRNHPQIRFEFRIHEQIIPAIRRLGGEVAWSDIFVVHSGADLSAEGQRKKLDRDLNLLNLEIMAVKPTSYFYCISPTAKRSNQLCQDLSSLAFWRLSM